MLGIVRDGKRIAHGGKQRLERREVPESRGGEGFFHAMVAWDHHGVGASHPSGTAIEGFLRRPIAIVLGASGVPAVQPRLKGPDVLEQHAQA